MDAERGRYSSEDGRMSMEWAMPDWGGKDRALCAAGLHIATRKRVVDGMVNFSRAERWYCACGRRCWIKFDGHFVDSETSEPDAHLNWITDQIQQQAKMQRYRQMERAMSEQHPCWDEPYRCISCGCSTERPCVSHEGQRMPTLDPERMKTASKRARELRAEIWPGK